MQLDLSLVNFKNTFTYEGEEEPDIEWIQRNYNVVIETHDHDVIIHGDEEDLHKIIKDHRLNDYTLKEGKITMSEEISREKALEKARKVLLKTKTAVAVVYGFDRKGKKEYFDTPLVKYSHEELEQFKDSLRKSNKSQDDVVVYTLFRDQLATRETLLKEEFEPFFFKGEDGDWFRSEARYVGDNLDPTDYMDKYDRYDEFVGDEFSAKVLGGYGNNQEMDELQRYFEEQYPKKAAIAKRLFKESVDSSVTTDYNRDVLNEKSLKEDSEMTAKQLLAKYLEISEDEIEESSWENHVYEVRGGEESYLVCSEYEARERAEDDVRSLIDDLGIGGFAPAFLDWIKDNAIDSGWFEDALREFEEGYVDDIENEPDSVYENRLISELVDEGLLGEDDFDNWGEDYPTLKGSVDLNSKKEEYVDELVESAGDPIDYFRLNWGENEFNSAIEENNLIDADKVAEEAVDWDGVAHFIATYDGDEIDLGEDLYAYRLD